MIIDFFNLLDGKAVVTILELRNCARSIRKANCKQDNVIESHTKYSIEK